MAISSRAARRRVLLPGLYVLLVATTGLMIGQVIGSGLRGGTPAEPAEHDHHLGTPLHVSSGRGLGVGWSLRAFADANDLCADLEIHFTPSLTSGYCWGRESLDKGRLVYGLDEYFEYDLSYVWGIAPADAKEVVWARSGRRVRVRTIQMPASVPVESRFFVIPMAAPLESASLVALSHDGDILTRIEVEISPPYAAD